MARNRPSKAHRQARATAARAHRREALFVLLARLDRGNLATAEHPLLRAHVETELTEADELRTMLTGQQAAAQRLARQFDAAHDAIREAEARANAAEVTIDRVRALLDTHLGPLATTAVRTALDTPEG